MTKNAPFHRRMRYALSGIRHALAHERSFRTQAVFAFGTVAVLVLLQPGWLWTATVLGMIGLVLMAELFNTALEALIDGLHPEQAEFIRVAKDCAAGAVLVISLAATGVGIAMLADRLPQLW